MKKLSFCLLAMLFAFTMNAQVTGKVIDATNGSALVGATVNFVGSTTGTITDIDGMFSLNGSGDAIEISYIGFNTMIMDVTTTGTLGEIRMSQGGVGLSEVVITGVIDIARERSTPVAVSNITSRDIQLKLGNQEFPEIMKTTPSIYVTKQGGGYGDGRINVRGFDQTNTSYIINGQPVNDMENGRVFWSNWAGLSDMASAIQIQRGIGASRLAVPSVGGTVNIVTKTTEAERGGFVNLGVGNDGYLKTTVGYNTGQSDNGLSAALLLGRWQGNGYVDGTQGQGYNYMAAVGWDPGNGHKFNASFVGAGQWHHQRSAWLSIRDFENFAGDGDKRKFNSDWGLLDGEEYTFRRNFYNKPIASLNWDWEVSSNTTVGAVLYGSWGRGGGTGPRGRNFGIYPFREDLTQAISDGDLPFRTDQGLIDFDAVVANNQTGNAYTGGIAGGSGLLIGSNGFSDNEVNSGIAIRRSSINSHDWYGAIVNLNHKIGNMTLGLGLDGRSYSGIHYRNVNDLLGLGGYYSTGDDNNPDRIITETNEASPFGSLGDEDKINYYNIGNVSWLGVNGLAEYETEQVTAVVQVGVSNQSYQREDFFSFSGDEQQSETHSILGGFVKGGANYNINAQHNVFFNAGYILRQPNFDAVFPNFAQTINEDVDNENIVSLELGYGLKASNLSANINLYTTSWGNRFISQGVALENGLEGVATYENLKNVHSGIEIEARYDVNSKFDLRGSASIGNWTYNGNVDATVFDDDQNEIGTSTLYLEGVKVGDAAQTTFSLGGEYEIINGLKVDATYLYFANLYADFAVTDNTFSTADNPGAVKLPSYGLVDFGVTYNVNINSQLLTLRLNVNNVLDTEYISESKTNLHPVDGEETFNGLNRNNFVWWGFGRTWNVSAKYSF